MDSSNFLFSNQVSTFSLSSKSKNKFNSSNFGQQYNSDNINYNSNYLNNSNRFHLLNSSHSNWRQKPQISSTNHSQQSHHSHWRQKPQISPTNHSQNSHHSHWRQKPYSKSNPKFQKNKQFPPYRLPQPHFLSSDFPPISSSTPTHTSSNLPSSQILPYKLALQSNSHLSFNQQVNESAVDDDDLSSESSIDWDLEEQIDLIPTYIQNFIDSQFPFQDYYQFFHRGSLKFIDDELINSSNESTTLQLILLQSRLNIPFPIDVEQLQFIILGYLKVLFPDPCDSDSFLSDDKDFF